MNIIEELGNLDTGLIDKRHGTKVFRKYALFECSICKKHISIRRDKGLKQVSCKSCVGKQNTTHGHSDKPYYNVWQAMIQRCTNPNNKKYHIYGGKGITVQESWLTFEGFWKDNEPLYQDGLTIDRKDSSKGYNVENVRWIPSKQNSSETAKRKSVIQYRLALKPEKHLVEVKQWNSALEAANELGLVASHIGAVCLNKRSSHGGFVWKYKE